MLSAAQLTGRKDSHVLPIEELGIQLHPLTAQAFLALKAMAADDGIELEAQFFKEGHDDGTNNYALCLDEAQRCILILSNSSNGEGIFLYLADALIGETDLPWEWEGYVPYDRK